MAEKPETMAPAGTATGNGRAAMVCAAAARPAAGSVSRCASAARRSAALASISSDSAAALM
jgi:hypothetical protein